MAEGQELTGVARTAATAAAALLVCVALLSVGGLVLPWWTQSEKGQLVDKAAVEAEITLWDFDLKVGKQASDGAGGTTIKVESRQMTWNQMCEIAENGDDGEPPECDQVRALRAFTILVTIFSLAGAAVFWMSRTVSPLLLLLGAVLAAISGLLSILAVGVGAALSTSGLTGGGVICMVAGTISSFTPVSMALYAAGIAMPADVPPKKSRETRQQRVQAQGLKDLEMARDLEANVAKNKRDKGTFMGQLDEESVVSSSKNQRKAPVRLKQVIYWGEEEGKDGEPLPTWLLEEAFQEMDQDRSGSIDQEELVENLALCGLPVSDDAITQIMTEIDRNANGEIDIHEFVDFFRSVEELTNLQERTQQRAQFTQFLCNFCFIAHIIIVSVLLMNFINMDQEADPDGYLIYQNLLMAFSLVLGLLLVWVICLPAARLTIGGNIAAWERAYNHELHSRAARRNQEAPQKVETNLRQAAVGEYNLEGLTDHTVNAAQYGSSYRLKKQQEAYRLSLEKSAVKQVDKSHEAQQALAAAQGSRRGTKNSGQASKSSQGNGVVLGADGSLERYDPNAFREAAMQSKMRRVPNCFSPMQVREVEVPNHHEEMALPGALALQDNPGPQDGALTGTGYYQREL